MKHIYLVEYSVDSYGEITYGMEDEAYLSEEKANQLCKELNDQANKRTKYWVQKLEVIE